MAKTAEYIETDLSDLQKDLTAAWFMQDPRALFFLSADRKVLLMNRFAEDLLQEGEFFQIRNGLLEAKAEWPRNDFRERAERALSHDEPGWGVFRPAGGDGSAGVYSVAPLRQPSETGASLLVCFLPPLIARARLSTILDQFGLTQTEKEIALALIDEHPLSTIAEHRGVRPSTVKSHVKNIYGKTATTGRVQFMSQFLMMAAIWV